MTSTVDAKISFSSFPAAPRVPNNRVACSPFESLSIETSGVGFKVVKQKNSLLRLLVVYGNDQYQPGDTIYVRGDVITMPWTKEVFQVDKTPFILVPHEYIQVVFPGSPSNG